MVIALYQAVQSLFFFFLMRRFIRNNSQERLLEKKLVGTIWQIDAFTVKYIFGIILNKVLVAQSIW